ncbi:MAG: hypothetical protein KKF44_08225 [Nanoarchaeota archaeon]|nr:hypothetical protein [Nanoarchaeota archaeon]
MIDADISRLETVLMQGMQSTRDTVLASFGVPTTLSPKTEKSVLKMAVSQIDMGNQEAILRVLFDHFPEIEISVEERLDDPTEVQAKFYANHGKSEYCVTLDALDGSFAYEKGINKDYGIIASIIKRTDGNMGKMISGLIYYPAYDMFYLANNKGLFEIKGDERVHLKKKKAEDNGEQYSAIITHDRNRLHLDIDSFKNDLYSCTEIVRKIVQGEIPGYLMSGSQVLDSMVSAWMLSKWGADVIYANGESLGNVHFGDLLDVNKRTPPRDTGGLFIVGDKTHKIFGEYMRHHHPD